MQVTSSSRDQLLMSVNFTARYMKKEQLHHDKLEEYFKVEQEQWKQCNPLKWWVGHHAQFPNLFGLACDILTIPNTFPIFFLSLCLPPS